MHIIHGTWVPQTSPSFENIGRFCVWVETEEPTGTNDKLHPSCLNNDQLLFFFEECCPINKTIKVTLPNTAGLYYFTLPTDKNTPLPSYEMINYLGQDQPETFSLDQWRIWCLQPSNPLGFLKEFHFLSLHYSEFRLGTDFLFWYHYSQAFKKVILKDHYIPAVKIRKIGKGKSKNIEFLPAWQIISSQFEEIIQPVSCRSGQDLSDSQQPFYDPETLLRHFSEQTLEELISQVSFTQQQIKSTKDTLVEACLNPSYRENIEQWQKTYQQWYNWKMKLESSHTDSPFILCFRLIAAEPDNPNDWKLEFLAESKKDPSLKIELLQYWSLKNISKREFQKMFGKDFERNFLIQMGSAARIYPRLWQGLETGTPEKVTLTINEAFSFLKEDAWVLEDAGYKVMVPSWWTPEGRKRAKLRMKVSGVNPPKQEMASGYFNLHSLARFKYKLSIGGEEVTEKEWQMLINAKTSLVQFRGQWMELDQNETHDWLESM